MLNPEDISLLQVLAYNYNTKQDISLVKYLDPRQKNIFRKIATQILNETIPLTEIQFKNLKRHKVFVRSLTSQKISTLDLLKNYKVLKFLAEIYLNNQQESHETHTKNSSSSSGRMGKSEKQTDQRNQRHSDSEYSSESTNIYSSSSEGNSSSDEARTTEQFPDTNKEQE